MKEVGEGSESARQVELAGLAEFSSAGSRAMCQAWQPNIKALDSAAAE